MTKSSKKKKHSESFYFDDCPICQAMKKADQEDRELGMEELISAFKEAKTEYKG